MRDPPRLATRGEQIAGGLDDRVVSPAGVFDDPHHLSDLLFGKVDLTGGRPLVELRQ
jgi:hypothetical protein